MSIKDKFIHQCLELLQRDDVKDELKNVVKPLVGLFVKEIYPYFFISIIFVLISFLLILGIFILLLRTKKKPPV